MTSKFKLKSFLLLLISSLALEGIAQSSIIPRGNDAYHIHDRLEVLTGLSSPIFSSLKSYRRTDMAKYAFELYKRQDISPLDRAMLAYIMDDNNEYLQSVSETMYYKNDKVYVDSSEVFYTYQETKGSYGYTPKERSAILKYFYKTESDFWQVKTENFLLKADPILLLSGSYTPDDPNTVFQNTRGLEIRGMVDNKVYFYSNVLENQRRFNDFTEGRISKFQTVPGQGLYKTYNSAVWDRINGWDYLNATAYLGLPISKNINIEFGHGGHFIGNGHRSLLLSDYAHNYFYLKLDTRVWKFHYQNLFTELAPVSVNQNPSDILLPKKYMASHYLTFKVLPSLELGLFEAVVFSREDHFEFQYLNPVILYRTVEQFLDSPDNVLIGLNGKWNLMNRFSLYGQLMLDEFKISELTSDAGWWGNKYGIQMGAKYFDAFGIDYLDAQVEYNTVRPFTYSHGSPLEKFPDQSVANYSHHNQPLAHPLGANFKEAIFMLKYRPSKRLSCSGKLIFSKYGEDDTSDVSNGGNVLIVNTNRNGDYGHNTGQGLETDVTLLRLDVSYMFWHNYFVDLNVMIRDQKSQEASLNYDTKYFGLGLRANLFQKALDY